MKYLVDRLRHKTSTGLYFRDLDSFRGWAVTGVVLAHFREFLSFPGMPGNRFVQDFLWSAGIAGVDVFFFISGFLLYISLSRGGNTLRLYYVRRVLRIVPAYYINLAAMLALGFALLDGYSVKDILYHLFFLHNIDMETIQSINGVYWSLAAEFQFYVMLPFVVSWFGGNRKFAVLAVFLALSVLFKLGSFIVFGEDMQVFFKAWQFLVSKLDLFMIGVTFSAVWLETGKGKDMLPAITRRLRLVPLCLLALGLLVLLAVNWRASAVICIYWDELFVLLFGLIVFAVLKGGRGMGVVINPLFEFIGIISYSVFLWHVGVKKYLPGTLTVLFDFTDDASRPVMFVLCMMATLFISLASYILIERPFMSYRPRYLSREKPTSRPPEA